MEKLLETLGKNELINKDQMVEYFNEMANNKEVLFEYLADKPYKLEIGGDDKCKKLMHFDSKTNTYTFNLAWFNINHLDLLNDPYEHNLCILDYLHTMVADAELRKAIKNGCLYIFEPEAFVCIVHEYIDNFNARDRLVRSNYCDIRRYEYNIKALETACVKYGLPTAYYNNYVNYANQKIKKMSEKKRYSTLEEAMIYENTPISIFTDWLEIRKYGKEIKELFGEKVLEKYNQAIDLFIRRGYIKVSDTLFGKLNGVDYPSIKELKARDDLSFGEKVFKFHFGNYENNKEELSEAPIMNKLLFGKRLNDSDRSTIDYAIDFEIPITYLCDQLSNEEVNQNIR